MTEQFAILRFGKFKTDEHVERALKHNAREIPVRQLQGSPFAVCSHGFSQAMSRYHSRLNTQKKIRTNGVRAIEVILSCSPSFFRDDPEAYGVYEREKVDILEAKVKEFIEENFFAENVVQYATHLDEATPHLQVILVPIDRKGKLNARGFIGEPKLLRELQDKWAEKLKPFNVQRGVSKSISKARHIPLRAYYHYIQKMSLLKFKEYLKAGINLSIQPIKELSIKLSGFRKLKNE